MTISLDEWREAIKPQAMLYPAPDGWTSGDEQTNQSRIEVIQDVFGKWRWPSRG